MKKIRMIKKGEIFFAGILVGAVSFLAFLAHGAATDDFVITVDTSLGNGTNSFTIPTLGTGYNYNVDCDNDGINEAAAQTGNYTCNYASSYHGKIRIKDNSGTGTGFPRIYFNGTGDKDKLTGINQWGTGK